MKLVQDWRKGWKWLSVQFAAIGLAASAAWLAVPADLTATVPDWARNVVSGVIFAGVLVGRMVDQGGSDGPH